MTMTAPLRRVLVREPGGLDRWRQFGWRGAPDPRRIAKEHEAFCAALADAGAEVVVAQPLEDDPDAIYVHDPAALGRDGAVLLRPGKEARRGEVRAIERELRAAGIAIAARLAEPATAEGGDMLWLDDETLVVGRGYRTNDAGIAALRAALPAVDVIPVDLPHLHGPAEVLHLLSLVSLLATDVALVYLRLLPVRLVQLLLERGVELVEVPDEEFGSLGCNVLALAPRVALAVDGNRETRRRMENAGSPFRCTAAASSRSRGTAGRRALRARSRAGEPV